MNLQLEEKGTRNEKENHKNKQEKIFMREIPRFVFLLLLCARAFIQPTAPNYFCQLQQQPSSPAAIYPRGAVAANRTFKRYFIKAFC
jgi:hypothetical protein